MVRVSVIDPRESPAWEEFVTTCPEATVFHTAHWARVLVDSYGFAPRYYALTDAGGDVQSALPLMLVQSWLTGRRLVGLPFSDACPPLATEAEGLHLLLATAARDAERQHLRYVEVRGGEPSLLAHRRFVPQPGLFVQHVLRLDRGLDELMALVHPSTRGGMRKARRLGLRVHQAGPEGLPVFYELYCLTRRRHGLVPAPYRFFQAMSAHLLEKGLGTLLFVEFDGEALACNLLLWWRNTVVYKFNVSRPDALQARPNNLLMWATIELAKEMGMSCLDLGRSDADQEGLRRFKSAWGAEEHSLTYFYFPGPEARSRGAARWFGRLLGTLGRSSPDWAYRRVWPRFYRHLG